MKKPVTITSQDWYRVRRGEDEIFWDRCHNLDELPSILLSRRAFGELSFLQDEKKRLILERLRQISADPYSEYSARILRGAGRQLTQIDALRIIFRVDPDTEKILVSTIRGGKVLDPEAVGPPP